MNAFKEMMAKTGCQLVGLVRSVDQYTDEKTGEVYHSVRIDMKDQKDPFKVSLPPKYDRSHLVEGELVKMAIGFKPSYDKKSLKIEAKI